MTLRRWLPLALLVPLSAAASRSARADDLSDLQGMLSETVVTTASKSAETGTDAPATSTTITAEDLRRYGIHSLDEAIDFLSLGVVTANPLGPPDIGARGVMFPRDFGDHFLLLINGHAVNNPLFGTARFGRGAGIPMEMIDHIEVILGPGSVLYGSNAMLGVINVITKRAKDWHGTHAVAEVQASRSDLQAGGTGVRPSWYRGAAGAGYEFKLFGAASEATVGLEYQQQKGPAFSFGPQYGGTDVLTGIGYRYNRGGPQNGIWGGIASDTYDSQVLAGHLRLISGNFELNLHASTYRWSTPYRSRFTHPYDDFNNPGYELERSLWLDLKHHVTLSPIVQLTTRVYADTWDYQDLSDTSQIDVCRYNIETCQLHLYGESRWAGAEVQSSFDWLKDASLVTLAGLDGRLRFVRAKTDRDDFDTGQHLESSFGVVRGIDQTLGAYLQQTWQPAHWLGFNGGVRLDTENRFPKPQVSPRLAGHVDTWKGGTLKAVYAEAYRAPTYIEEDYGNPNQIPGGSLSPERERSLEGSISQTFGTQRLLFGVFRTWWSDMVELHLLTPDEINAAAAAGIISNFTGSDFTQWRNVTSIDNYGFNAAYSGMSQDGALRYAVNLTGAYSRRNELNAGTLAVPVTPAFFGNARVSYDLPGLLPTLAVAGRFMGKRPADRAFEGVFTPVPYAPPQVELRAAITGEVPLIHGLSYRLDANYAFAPRGPYVVGPATPIGSTAAELVPVDQVRVGVGLQYDFLR